VSVRGINRAGIRGSFLISAFVTIDGTRQRLGTEAVLSRWHVEGCMNCQSHLEARAHFAIADEVATPVAAESVEIELHTRSGRADASPASVADASPASVADASLVPRFSVSVR